MRCQGAKSATRDTHVAGNLRNELAPRRMCRAGDSHVPTWWPVRPGAELSEPESSSTYKLMSNSFTLLKLVTVVLPGTGTNADTCQTSSATTCFSGGQPFSFGSRTR